MRSAQTEGDGGLQPLPPNAAHSTRAEPGAGARPGRESRPPIQRCCSITETAMTPHSLRVLEYEAVRRRVVDQASCSLGQERARRMEPSWREEEVLRWQAETREAFRLLALPGAVPLGGIHDLRPALRAAGVGGTLEPPLLLMVADTLAAGKRLKVFLAQRHEQAPSLAELARRIDEFPHLAEEILQAISEQGEVRDEASPLLARIRKELRQVRARMTDRLQAILRGSGYRDMIQDPVITTREGRYCIPVKSEYRSQFGGLIHDQSASGATVFMEPTAVVELGNELRQLDARERLEIERILRELSAQVGRHAAPMTETVELLGELDFIFARGKLAQAMDAVEPQINKQGFIGLRRARHPLLSGHVVPLDLDLGRENSVLVITGPNTGGKTVSLKTVGLLALMAQSGLQIPADEGSTLPVFHGVYADIGDEQSIQQSLSTFSGHITNIAKILSDVSRTGRRSLVLLDEVGAGTDPTEGAALARAILQSLLQSGARTIATTHYGELKEFAYSSPGVENASVEFDHESLRPTYRLLVGIPGTSNAFAIAARLGLPQPLVEAARAMIGTDRLVLSDVIQSLTEEKRATEQDLRKAAEAARDVEAMREQYERQLRKLEVDRTETLNRARQQADEMLRAARRDLDRVKEELRRAEKQARRASTEPGTGPAIQGVREKLQRISGRVEKQADKVERKVPLPAPAPADEGLTLDRNPPAPGDLVWVAGLNQRGTLLSSGDGRAQVLIGSMRTTVPAENVRRILTPGAAAPARPAVPAPNATSDLRMRARANISPEIHLRGMRAEEAVTRLDRYLDDAALAGLSPVRVVHGKGTGALKKMVWEFLQGHPHVSRYRHAEEEEGGSGVTLVDLRE